MCCACLEMLPCYVHLQARLATCSPRFELERTFSTASAITKLLLQLHHGLYSLVNRHLPVVQCIIYSINALASRIVLQVVELNVELNQWRMIHWGAPYKLCLIIAYNVASLAST